MEEGVTKMNNKNTEGKLTDNREWEKGRVGRGGGEISGEAEESGGWSN